MQGWTATPHPATRHPARLKGPINSGEYVSSTHVRYAQSRLCSTGSIEGRQRMRGEVWHEESVFLGMCVINRLAPSQPVGRQDSDRVRTPAFPHGLAK